MAGPAVGVGGSPAPAAAGAQPRRDGRLPARGGAPAPRLLVRAHAASIVARRDRADAPGVTGCRDGRWRGAAPTPAPHRRLPGCHDEHMKGRVLIVDDDTALAEMLGIVLRGEGFEPVAVRRRRPGAGGVPRAQAGPRAARPDAARAWTASTSAAQIRAESGVPIVMLTAKTDTIDVVVGLESGADDYIVKPFKPKELVARIRARLRRTEEPAPGAAARSATSSSTSRATRSSATARPIALTPLEFDLLVALARKPWQVFTREVLLEQVWGYRHAADTRLVNVHVQRLRSKMERDPEQPGGRRHGARRRVQGGSGLTASAQRHSAPTARRASRPGSGARSAAAGAGRSLLWRRSLQLRVVTTTTVFSVIVDRGARQRR